MLTKNALIAPTININGSDGHQMLFDQHEAIIHLQIAATKLRAVYPHGRDYQSEDENQLGIAILQHGRWMQWVAKALEELKEINECTKEQVDARAK